MDYNQLKEWIKNGKQLYIYGAGVVAYGASVAIKASLGISNKAYLVTDKKNNSKDIAGIPVIEIDELKSDKSEITILIATPEEYHSDIMDMLQKKAYTNVWALNSHLEYCLMGEYLKQTCGIKMVEDLVLDREKHSVTDTCIAMAVSHGDRPLQFRYEEEDWVKKIQVGAVLTQKEIASVKDSIGDNLSKENGIYGELTASYWFWKNELHDIMGLYHYRRVLNAKESHLQALQAGEIDVILPLPFVCYPDASGQYRRYLAEEDEEIMWKVLETDNPEYYRAAKEKLRTPYLYNYNMLIARKEVFVDYCEWMFPLLEKIVNQTEMLQIERLPRYIGRIGEVLTSIYFLVNEKNWKIIHAEKRWRI